MPEYARTIPRKWLKVNGLEGDFELAQYMGIKYFDVKLLLEITGTFEEVSSRILEGCLSGR